MQLPPPAGSWWLTCVSGATLAAVVVGKLDAAVRASWVTGVGETFIHISLTALPDIPCRADALIPSDLIHTFPLVEALWLFGERVEERVAVIDVDFTVHAWMRYSKDKGTIVSITVFNDGMSSMVFSYCKNVSFTN